MHAPKLTTNIPERNFTIEWLKQTTTSEEIVQVASVQNGLHIENDISPYYYPSASFVGGYVSSNLSFDLERVSSGEIAGTYWCQVLAKTQDEYSFSVIGRSNTQTVIPTMEEYTSRFSHHPPCLGVQGEAFHQPSFKCVYDEELTTPLPPPGGPGGDTVSISTGALAAVAIAGGALFVVLLILMLVVIYLCRVVNERKGSRGKQRDS